MALIKCPECGKEISNKAKCCIHCGYPLDEISSNEYKDILTRECLNEKEDTHNFSQKINSSFDKINYTQKQPETLRDLVQKRDSETKNIEIIESQPIPKSMSYLWFYRYSQNINNFKSSKRRIIWYI